MSNPANETRGFAMLRCLADLHTTGVNITRERLRRDSPHATPDEIGRQLRSWLGHDGVTDLLDTGLRVPTTSRFRQHA